MLISTSEEHHLIWALSEKFLEQQEIKANEVYDLKEKFDLFCKMLDDDELIHYRKYVSLEYDPETE